jgi:hypothetical protein
MVAHHSAQLAARLPAMAASSIHVPSPGPGSSHGGNPSRRHAVLPSPCAQGRRLRQSRVARASGFGDAHRVNPKHPDGGRSSLDSGV